MTKANSDAGGPIPSLATKRAADIKGRWIKSTPRNDNSVLLLCGGRCTWFDPDQVHHLNLFRSNHFPLDPIVIVPLPYLSAVRKQKMRPGGWFDALRLHPPLSALREMLLERLRPAIEQFNSEFQFGKIQVNEQYGTTYYALPIGRSIQVTFFAPAHTGIKIRGGTVIGGGWIGISDGRSANLVLLKDSDDDLYGRWIICEVKLMALVDARKIIGKFGLTSSTIQPFGFQDAYFYDQIAYAQGGVHVFTYSFIDNIEEYFAALIAEACK